MGSARCRWYLPHELIVEILSYIPVKGLMRWRCVSKPWNDLVLDPTFVKLHLQRSSKNIHMLYTWKPILDPKGFRCGPSSMHCSTVQGILEHPSSAVNGGEVPCEFDNPIDIIGTCNGLVCLRVIEPFDENDVYNEVYIRFWNPSMRITSDLSPPLESQILCYSRSCVSLGFGYDDSSDTYKVLALVMKQKSTNIEVSVHCLGDKFWRKIANAPTDTRIERYKGHFLSGTLNWMARHVQRTDEHVIFSFDLRKDTYRYLSMPDGLETMERFQAELGILKGCLCLGAYDIQSDADFSLWQMKEFGVRESWTLLMITSCVYLQIDSIVPWAFEPRPLRIYENGDVLLLMNRSRFKLFLYNKKDNRMQNIETINKSICLHTSDFVQTLVLPYCN
ncbi:F-box/kelch-repeat protein At3g23880-like [Abrus precatorius]|uniref:F-box/kelch-repeat protein At3g23880-like n=1 Tax=Abrus precatorius TaxID=3816 RepID=A0A8B8L951_ABRPR|nr:F-box/kelch-repeat protein At3g23880-like [Abrus precatorius]